MNMNFSVGPSSDTYYAHILATTASGLLVGSSAWTSFGVMPSIIAAQTSSHAKLSIFDGLIKRTNTVIPAVTAVAASAFSYLAYYSASPTAGSSLTPGANAAYGIARRNLTIGAASLFAALGLQVLILPLNNEVSEMVENGQGKEDNGEEANKRIEQVWVLYAGRVALSAIAFGVGLTELYKL